MDKSSLLHPASTWMYCILCTFIWSVMQCCRTIFSPNTASQSVRKLDIREYLLVSISFRHTGYARNVFDIMLLLFCRGQRGVMV